MPKRSGPRLYRKPVRDPIAGILADWFGLEQCSAMMLWLLYQANERLNREAVAARTGMALNNVTLCSGRIRRALGDDAMSKWSHKGYWLTINGQRQVREALQNAQRQLGAHLPDMARLEALEDALGLSAEAPSRYGLTRIEEQIFGMLGKTDVLHRERIRAALYGHHVNSRGDKIIDAHICHMRRKLKKHRVTIRTVWGVGYTLERSDAEVARAA